MADVNSKLLRILIGTAEIYGRNMSSAAAEIYLEDLKGFDPEMIAGALAKCRKELRTFPTIADILARIDDGRPGVEEAWAMIPQGEDESVVLNNEIADAYASCRHLLLEDKIAARMTFKETYVKIVAKARNEGRPPRWFPSFGRNQAFREAAVQHAVDRGRVTLATAQEMLPDFALEAKRVALPFSVAGLIKHLPGDGGKA